MIHDIKGIRFYDTDIGLVPSVTSILGIIDKGVGLVMWFKYGAMTSMYEHIRDLAEKGAIAWGIDLLKALKRSVMATLKEDSKAVLGLGTRVHEKLEEHIKRQMEGKKVIKIKCLPDEKSSIDAFLEWELEYKPHYIKSEQFVWSKLGYAGTFDLLAIINGKLTLIDFKTSKSFYDTMGLQLSAYSNAYTERTSEKIENLAVLRLPKDNAKFEYREFPYELDIFKLVLGVWKWHNREILEKVLGKVNGGKV